MRKAVLALLMLTGGELTASAQQAAPWAEKLFTAPQVKGTLSHDFGSIPRGTQLYHRFKLYNPYAATLEIKTRVGCNCVTVSPDTLVVKPREEAYLDVTMDTRRFPGVKTVNIFVTTGPQYVSTATLVVSANSRVDVVLNPGQISFGAVTRGTKLKAQTLDVEYAGALDWKVTEVAKHTLPVDVQVIQLYRRTGQVGYQVQVTLKPDAPVGTLKQDLYLKTNDPATPLVPILVEATVQANLTVLPNPVNLGSLKVGESVTKRIVVKGPKAFKIQSIEGTGEGLTAELPTLSQQVQIVLIKYQPAKAGKLSKQLQIKTDLDKDPTTSVTVEGTAEP
jgi:hypothetical protein